MIVWNGRCRGFICRRPFLALAVAAMLVGVGCTGQEKAGQAGKKPDQVTIATISVPNLDPIVRHEGWFDKAAGVPVQWREFPAGPDVARAVASGNADLGYLGSSPMTAGLANGLKYDLIWIYDIIGETEAVVAKKTSHINSIADLVGKKVATAFGSTTHYSLIKALEANGISESQVTILDMQAPEALAAWERGDIDASAMWEPILSKMVHADGKIIVTSKQLADQGIVTSDVGIVNRDFAKKFPDVVTAWIAQLNRAVALLRNDPDAAATAVADVLDISKSEAAVQLKPLVVLDARKQLSAEWLGPPGKPGKFADYLADAAEFLAAHDIVPQFSSDVFSRAVNSQFIAQVGR